MGSQAYSEDVFISYKENGEWTEPVSIGDNINTEDHDAAIGLSVDGQTLFIYKTDNGNNDIYANPQTLIQWVSLIGDIIKESSNTVEMVK